MLPRKPNGVDDVVVTVFWAGNFDCIVETQAGGGAINSTHLVAFQEKILQCSSSNTRVNTERDKRRSIDLDINEDMFKPIYDTKKEPDVLSKSSEYFEINTSWFLSKFVTWLLLRTFNDFDQKIPTFSALETDNRTKSMEFGDVKKTVETYVVRCVIWYHLYKSNEIDTGLLSK